MTIEEQVERLTGIVGALADSVVAHDTQIEGLIRVAESQERRLREVTEALANVERQWQAYIKTLPHQ